jgi:hypothetical protein
MHEQGGAGKQTFDIAVYVLRPESGHERRTLGGERGVCLIDPKRGVVYEKLLLNCLQLRNVIFLIRRCCCGVLRNVSTLPG